MNLCFFEKEEEKEKRRIKKKKKREKDMRKSEIITAVCGGAIIQVDATIFNYAEIVLMARAALEKNFVLPIINAKSLKASQIINLGEQAPGHVKFLDAEVSKH